MSEKESEDKRIKGEKEKLIGYCGLYCGDCSGYKGTIANLARDLRKELDRERFGELAKVLSKIPFFKALESLSFSGSRGRPTGRSLFDILHA